MVSLELDAQTRLKLVQGVSELAQDQAWLNALPPFDFDNSLRAHTKLHARLKIGYVSPDFRYHPVGLLTAKIYGLHDKSQFEIYGYSLFDNKDHKNDAIHDEIAAGCDTFREVAALNDAELAKLIYQDEIDILVDLAGYTTFARAEVFALRPAPLQIAYLGYPGTLGADFIDYAIVDSVVCKPGDEVDWHEKPVRLPKA